MDGGSLRSPGHSALSWVSVCGCSSSLSWPCPPALASGSRLPFLVSTSNALLSRWTAVDCVHLCSIGLEAARWSPVSIPMPTCRSLPRFSGEPCCVQAESVGSTGVALRRCGTRCRLAWSSQSSLLSLLSADLKNVSGHLWLFGQVSLGPGFAWDSSTCAESCHLNPHS